MTPNYESVRVMVSLMLDPVTNTPMMVLTNAAGPKRRFAIWCGHYEANAIALELEGVPTPRPMTHDLLANVIEESGGHVNFVEVSALKDDTFYAEIHVQYGDSTRVLDARPSDAIALAVRARSRIYVANEIFDAYSSALDVGAGVLPDNGGDGEKVVTVVFSYSHKDEKLRAELDAHLKLLQRRGLMSTWSDRKILGGERWSDVIDKNFAHADLIVLLVSADFLASDYCYEIEMTTALARESKGEALVVPVILRACDWSEAPFGHLQALPGDGKPITSWSNQDEAWHEVVVGIKKAMKEFRSRRAAYTTK